MIVCRRVSGQRRQFPVQLNVMLGIREAVNSPNYGSEFPEAYRCWESGLYQRTKLFTIISMI
jgi:hypothetical protein